MDGCQVNPFLPSGQNWGKNSPDLTAVIFLFGATWSTRLHNIEVKANLSPSGGELQYQQKFPRKWFHKHKQTDTDTNNPEFA